MRKTLIISIVVITAGMLTALLLSPARGGDPSSAWEGPVVYAGKCTDSLAPDSEFKPLAELDIKTPLYVLGKTGKLYQFNPSGKKWKLLADAGFIRAERLQHVHGGRWIGFAGASAAPSTEQYWLYDTVTGTAKMIVEDSDLDGERPILSPDGTMLAVSTSGKVHWPDGGGKGLYLIDTNSGRRIRIELPSGNSGDYRDSLAIWSADGSQLLIQSQGASAYWVAQQRLEKIDITLNRAEGVRRFFRDGVEIPQAPERDDPSARDRVSPHGQWQAHLSDPGMDRVYTLKATARDGTLRKIATGKFDPCMGDNLWMKGWLDDQHLAYAHPFPHFYVADAATGKTAVLFNEKDDLFEFSW